MRCPLIESTWARVCDDVRHITDRNEEINRPEYEDSLAARTTTAPTDLGSDLKLYLREDSGLQKKRKGGIMLQHFILHMPLSRQHTRAWMRGIDYVHGLSQIRHRSARKDNGIKLTAF